MSLVILLDNFSDIMYSIEAKIICVSVLRKQSKLANMPCKFMLGACFWVGVYCP